MRKLLGDNDVLMYSSTTVVAEMLIRMLIVNLILVI